MKYRLRFGIGYDEKNWQLETFEEQRRCFLEQLLESIGSEKGEYLNGDLVFHDANPMLANTLIQIAKYYGYVFNIGTSPVYASEEINIVRYVPLLIDGERIDVDKEGQALNQYSNILCKKCGRPDDDAVPTPYYVEKKEMNRLQDLYSCSNGIAVLSMKAFDLLINEIKEFVNYGEVLVSEKRKAVDYGKGLMWIKPKYRIGVFIDAKVKQKCDTCGNPTEIRQVRSKELFKMNVVAVESFNNVHAPIVLAGNWYGDIGPKRHCSRNHYVFISGELHKKIKDMKLKGFVEADYVIHAMDEEKLLLVK